MRQVVVGAALAAALFASCTRLETGSPPALPLGEGGVAGEHSRPTGSLAGGAGEGSGGEDASTGGAPDGIELSIWPTFAADPQQSRDSQAVFAAVSVLSAGASTLTLNERWDDLSGSTGTPRTLSWTRLDAMIKPYRERNGNVALCIHLVDRTDPAWPVTTPLTSKPARQAIERTIDEVFARYAAQLSHLCFGYEVDRYLASASAADAADLLDLLAHAVSHVHENPAYTPAVRVGVAVTLGALLDPDNQHADWLLGDEAIAVYDPLVDGGLKRPPTVADELVGALDALAQGSGLPLALWEVGYPSGAGSSEKLQRQYYDALFGLLDQRREQVSFVSSFGLSDRVASDCDAEALRFGEDAKYLALRSQARCSMGLRADGKNKLAWPTVLAAIARYR